MQENPVGKSASPPKIRPHRFGGEGVLIGVQTATLNAQVTFVNVAVAIYISALAGGGQKRFRTEPGLRWCFRDSCVSEVKKVWRCNFRRFLATEKRTKMRDLGCWSTQNTAKTSVLDQVYAQKCVNYFVFEENLETTL